MGGDPAGQVRDQCWVSVTSAEGSGATPVPLVRSDRRETSAFALAKSFLERLRGKTLRARCDFANFSA